MAWLDLISLAYGLNYVYLMFSTFLDCS